MISGRDEDVAWEKALSAKNDIGELKSMKSGQLSCKPVKKNGRDMLEITSGSNTMLLNPTGMALEKWTVNNVSLCSTPSGLSAFWSPGRHGMVLNHNYRITEQNVSIDGLQITGELTTTVRNYPQLPGLKITKTISVSTDLKNSLLR